MHGGLKDCLFIRLSLDDVDSDFHLLPDLIKIGEQVLHYYYITTVVALRTSLISNPPWSFDDPCFLY